MATICLDRQLFYTPPTTKPKPTTRGLLPQTPPPPPPPPLPAISGAPLRSPAPPWPQDAGALQPGGALIPQNDVIEISSDESDGDWLGDPGDGRSCNSVKSGSVVGTGNDVDATPDAGGDNDVSDLSVTGETDPNGESLRTQRWKLRLEAACAGTLCRQGLGCPKHPYLSTKVYRKNWLAKQRRDKEDTLPSGSPDTAQNPRSAAFSHEEEMGLRSDSCCRSPSHDHHGESDQASGPEHRRPPLPDGSGEQSENGPIVPSQSQESRATTPLLGDESISELELADAEPRPRSQSPWSAESNRGVEAQQGSGRCHLAQRRDHQDDSSQVSNPEQRDPLVPGDREEQDGEGHAVVPSQAQDGVAGLPRLSHEERDIDRELADAEPCVQSFMQLSVNQPRARLQRPLGRRRACDADEGGDSCPNVDSDAEHSEKDDVVRPPRRKRRKGSSETLGTGGTVSRRRTLPNHGVSLPKEAGGSSPRPKRQGKRGTTRPLSSREATLEPTLGRDPETDRDAVATFEEWPLGNAVLKRVTVDGSPPTFVVQFTWDPCVKHGTGQHGTESRSSVSAAKRRRPATQESTRSKRNESTATNAKPNATSRRARYTSADDAKIRQLKEQGLSWPAIAQHFPGRTAGAIEVRYHTKLKTAGVSRSGARQLCDHSRAHSAAANDAGGEEEWEVEEICGDRQSKNGLLELLVKWKGGEETWEPYENLAETEALDEYERLHGPATVVTV